ncbi:MAG TPA: hypothetical protein RMH26_09985, partial [Polyangiaceae bacterium LLY-WYZ-15_(1-7)]|nr:hypothetical protein [Polyangiaceae bacterium LLY-WYZ-15_(1-7)]
MLLLLLLAPDHLAELAHLPLELAALLLAHLLARHPVQLLGHAAELLGGLLPILRVPVQVLGGLLHLPAEPVEL